MLTAGALVQVRIESDPKEWPAQAAQLAAQRQQREALQASVRRVSHAGMSLAET